MSNPCNHDFILAAFDDLKAVVICAYCGQVRHLYFKTGLVKIIIEIGKIKNNNARQTT